MLKVPSNALRGNCKFSTVIFIYFGIIDFSGSLNKFIKLYVHNRCLLYLHKPAPILASIGHQQICVSNLGFGTFPINIFLKFGNIAKTYPHYWMKNKIMLRVARVVLLACVLIGQLVVNLATRHFITYTLLMWAEPLI